MKLAPKTLCAGSFLVLLLGMALFSDFLSPNPPSRQNLDQFFHPPTRLHIRDREGRWQRPYIHATALQDPLTASYRMDWQRAHSLDFFYEGYPYQLLGFIPWDRHLIGRAQPPYVYFLGADELGRDVWARILSGTRTSLLVIIVGILIYAVLGIAIGSVAGILGGWVDSLLMRFSEFVLALPVLYVVLAMRALLPRQLPFWQTLILTVGMIAAVAWPPLARGVRGMVLQLNSAMHVEAARSMGASSRHIFLQHMLPSLRPFIRMQLILAAPLFLLGELALSFLNVGFQDTGESWGAMLRNMKDLRILTDYYWNLAPLGMIFLSLLSLNSLGDPGSGDKFEGRILRF